MLPICPQFGGFLLIPCELEPSPTVVPHDVAYDGGHFLLRSQCGTLEFEKEAVLFWPFAFGHFVFVGGGHECIRVQGILGGMVSQEEWKETHEC